MAHKCALIVDDSRTARQVLGEVLVANQLRVETAASAEEALEFLSHHRPDVIFMDHMMPGMDGLQAVQAIKNNPATATIPIMMYTSQAGELYVGQARALGAVGVLPKQIKPVEVSEVLRSLRLVDGGVQPAAPDPAPAATPATAAVPVAPATPASGELKELRAWLQQLLDQHGQELRAQIDAAVERALRDPAGARPAEVVAPPVTGRRRSTPTLLLVLALATLAGVFFWLQLDTQQKWRAAVEQNTSLMAALNSRRTAAAATASETVRQLDAERDELSGRFGEFIGALEWSVNQAATYPAGGEPFDERRLETLRGLVDRLAALGFTGVVQLHSHVGNFCQVAGEDGALALAPAQLPAEQCLRIGLTEEEARAASARQSVRFANFLSTRPGAGVVRIEVQAHGNAAPAIDYPAQLQGVTAGEWNTIAALNNRVTVTLLPDGLQ